METNTFKQYEVAIEPRNHQIRVEDARNLILIDLFMDEDGNGGKHLSRADLILIFTLYPTGLNGFLDDYLNYVEEEVKNKGYKVVNKPHYFLKNIIG
ncbi:hypothetical protein [Romboutsia sp.]|uniref:hypothetical protein n=1 Tax=Romboutsia sp. TaxID=1965302 RepID=UPI002B94148C|nr:hypothetical protein [Romboutsia sp.]HSQ87986.1 hypothetical protein [Romboutsia sp.]